MAVYDGFPGFSFDRYLPRSRFEVEDNMSLEILNFEGGVTDPVIKDEPLPHEEFEDWLHQRGRYALPIDAEGRRPSGGLRLLYQRGERENQMPYNYRIPFMQEAFVVMIHALDLPKTVLEALNTPPGMCHIELHQQRIKIMIRSRSWHYRYWFLVLSYDPMTGITSGFLDMTNHDDLYRTPGMKVLGALPTILGCAKRAAHQASHPLFLPTMMLVHQVPRVSEIYAFTWGRIVDIEKATGLLESDMVIKNRAFAFKDLDEAHRRIAAVDRSLSDGSLEFELRLLAFLRESFSKLESHKPDLIQKLMGDHYELRSIVDFYTEMSHFHEDRHKSYSRRLDLQLKVLYNLIAQRDSRAQHSVAHDSRRIAAESKRDSSSMKTIAVLTMVFLPATTVAAIFSMSAFFTAGSESSISVSPRFWIYWAICIPLTFLVLVIWWFWLRRMRKHHLTEDEEMMNSDGGQTLDLRKEK